MPTLPTMASSDGAVHRRHELHAGDAVLAMREMHALRGAARTSESASDAEAAACSVIQSRRAAKLLNDETKIEAFIAADAWGMFDGSDGFSGPCEKPVGIAVRI